MCVWWVLGGVVGVCRGRCCVVWWECVVCVCVCLEGGSKHKPRPLKHKIDSNGMHIYLNAIAIKYIIISSRKHAEPGCV